MNAVRRFLLPFLLLLLALPAAAAEPSPALRQRASDLVALLNDRAEPAQLFSPEFLAQVPEAKVKAISAQLREAYGAARSVSAIDAASETAGTLHVVFDKATLRMEITVSPGEPNRITGLLVVGADEAGDTPQAVLAEMAALPGQVSVTAALLGEGPPQPILERDSARPLAVGSAFKLFVLAELAREVKAGERRWTDVVPLGRRSLPSGILQAWPSGAPMTLHSLAVLMISQSDNTAADTLIALLGREKIERLLAVLGVRAPQRDRPFLLTREAFLIKTDPALRARWTEASEAEKRALLKGKVADTDASRIDVSQFGGKPLSIGEVEWFASTSDLVRTCDWLRRNGDATTLDILAVAPGMRDTGAYAYAGYKGGSEAGVLNVTYLLRRKDGRWLGISISWNDPADPVAESRLALLVARLLPLLATG